jgi:hypothetical protein
MYFYVSYVCLKKQRHFPYTKLTDCALNLFRLMYEVNIVHSLAKLICSKG